MEGIEKHNILKKDIEILKIPPGSRTVLIRIDNRNVDSKTPSGIIKIAGTDTDWRRSVHSDRVGTVMKVPRDPMPFKVGGDLSPWETSVQIKEGDVVWFDFMAAENCVEYIDEDGFHYKTILYEDVFVAVRDAEVIPLNGFSLFERVYKKQRGRFDVFESDKVDTKRGIARFIAKKNKCYEDGESSDHIDLMVGDEVQYNTVPEVMLEDEEHCSFLGGKMFRRVQARNIDLAWRDGELILPKGRVLLKRIWDEKRTPAGIWLPRPNVKTHTGEIVVSSVDEIPVKSRVKYVMNAGRLLDYKGEQHRVVSDKHILYIE